MSNEAQMSFNVKIFLISTKELDDTIWNFRFFIFLGTLSFDI